MEMRHWGAALLILLAALTILFVASLGEERTSKLLAVYRLTPMHDGEGSALRVSVPVEPLLQRHEAALAQDRVVHLAAGQDSQERGPDRRCAD